MRVGLRTLVNLRHINAGFDMENLVIFERNPGAVGYNGDTLTPYYDRVQEALTAIPSVSNAALLDFALLSERRSTGGFRLTYRAELTDHDRATHRLTVNESFFATMDISLLDGRGFNAVDSGTASKVVVVNEAFARAYLEGGSPLGHTLSMAMRKFSSTYYPPRLGFPNPFSSAGASRRCTPFPDGRE